MSDAIPLRSARIAVACAFAMQGFLLAAILTQLPQYKDRFGLPDSIVVIAVVTVSAIAGVGSVLAELTSEWDSWSRWSSSSRCSSSRPHLRRAHQR